MTVATATTADARARMVQAVTQAMQDVMQAIAVQAMQVVQEDT